MNVGDLVIYKINKRPQWRKGVGIIIRCIPGSERFFVVVWANGEKCYYAERNLEVLNESR